LGKFFIGIITVDRTLPLVEKIMNDESKTGQSMEVTLRSFGFKYGAPTDVNILWDVRFLPNPYWQEELRMKTGLEKDVSDFVIGSSEGRTFLKLLKKMLIFIIQQNIVADKKELVLAVGCTGGRHRSVAMVEVIQDVLMMLPVTLKIEHRDIEKDTE
jgi:RNase adapter protein RapZ